MTHNIDKNSTDKKVKLSLPANLFQLAVSKAEQEDQTLEAWLSSLIEQNLQSQDPVHPLDWGRIDSRIDQRTVFLEQRIDVLAERLNQLSK